MRFCRKIDHPIWVVQAKQEPRQLVIADIPAHEMVTPGVKLLDSSQVIEVAGVSQQIIIDDRVSRVLLQPEAHEI